MKKKLLLFGLVIIGIGGYWLSQNMWVFEKQVAIENYEEKLNGTTWEKNKISFPEIIAIKNTEYHSLDKCEKLSFEKENYFKFDNCFLNENSLGNWSLKNNLIHLNYEQNINLGLSVIKKSRKMYIIHISNNHLVIFEGFILKKYKRI